MKNPWPFMIWMLLHPLVCYVCHWIYVQQMVIEKRTMPEHGNWVFLGLIELVVYLIVAVMLCEKT